MNLNFGTEIILAVKIIQDGRHPSVIPLQNGQKVIPLQISVIPLHLKMAAHQKSETQNHSNKILCYSLKNFSQPKKSFTGAHQIVLLNHFLEILVSKCHFHFWVIPLRSCDVP